MKHFCEILFVWAACAAANGQTTNPVAGDPREIENGRATFQRQCSSCHGEDARGGRAPDLTRSSLSEAEMFQKISNGVPGTEMRAYGDRGMVSEIWRIVAFVRSASQVQAPVPGDMARGETLFWGKGGCGSCHSIKGKGSLVGPDLSQIGRQRSVVNLRESLVDPSAFIVPGYNGVTVTFRDGKTVRGVQKALDDFGAVVQDFTGKVYSVQRSEVRSVVRDKESLMPAFGKTLSESELDDVIAYLYKLTAPLPKGIREVRQ